MSTNDTPISGNGINGPTPSPSPKKTKAKIKINGAPEPEIIPPKVRTIDEAVSSLFTEFNISSFPKLSWQRVGATLLTSLTIGYGIGFIFDTLFNLGMTALTMTSISGYFLIGLALFIYIIGFLLALYATFKLVEISANYILSGQIDKDLIKVANKIKSWVPSISIKWNKELIK